MVGTQFEAGFTFFIAAGRHQHPRAARFGQLNGGDTYAARAPLNQQSFASLQGGTVKHIAPHRKKSFRQRSRFDITQALRVRQALGNRRGAELGIAATGHQGAHTVTQLQPGLRQFCRISAHHHTGNFKAWNV